MQHSKNGPSGANRWLYCPGSAGADNGEEGEAAALGTLIHSLAAHRLAPNLHPLPDLSELEPDDLEFAYHCAERFAEKCREDAGDGIEVVEKRILDKESPDLFGGTLDFARVTEGYIHVYDLKSGRLDVSVERNEQIACYLLLARQHFGPRERYYGTIVQPRLGYVETAEYPIAALLDVDRQVRRCLGNEELRAGGHCEHCPLLGGCRTAAEHAQELVPILRVAGESDLPPELAEARRLVEFSKPIEKMVATASAALKEHIGTGGTVAGYKVSKRKGRRKIDKPDQFRDWVSDNWASWGFPESVTPDELLLKARELKTPAQIEKLIPDPIPEHLIDFGDDSTALLSDKKVDRAELFTNLDEFDELA